MKPFASVFYSVIALFIGAGLVGCASTPQLSPQQRRSLQMRTFENTSMENVFRAFKTVLQDEGYVIKNQDMNGGLIVAEIQKTDSSSGVWAVLAGAQNYRTGQLFEVSVNLEALNKSTIETRMVLQEKSQMSMGGQQGKEILEPTLYQAVYQKVKTEVERRKAQGKG
jgi:hypothetical protein